MTIVTLGVSDPDRTVRFTGMALARYPGTLLSQDAHLDDPGGFGGAHACTERGKYRRSGKVLSEAVKAGGKRFLSLN